MVSLPALRRLVAGELGLADAVELNRLPDTGLVAGLVVGPSVETSVEGGG